MVFGLFKSKPKMVKVKKKTKAQKPKVKKKVTAVKTKKRVVKKVGKITHYFPHVKAGVILVANEKTALGDTLQIKGHTTDLKQKISSMQVNNAPIKDDRLRLDLRSISSALSYLINSTSFREGEYFNFDKVNINKRLGR